MFSALFFIGVIVRHTNGLTQGCEYPSAPLTDSKGRLVECGAEKAKCPKDSDCVYLWLGGNVCCAKASLDTVLGQSNLPFKQPVVPLLMVDSASLSAAESLDAAIHQRDTESRTPRRVAGVLREFVGSPPFAAAAPPYAAAAPPYAAAAPPYAAAAPTYRPPGSYGATDAPFVRQYSPQVPPSTAASGYGQQAGAEFVKQPEGPKQSAAVWINGQSVEKQQNPSYAPSGYDVYGPASATKPAAAVVQPYAADTPATYRAPTQTPATAYAPPQTPAAYAPVLVVAAAPTIAPQYGNPAVPVVQPTTQTAPPQYAVTNPALPVNQFTTPPPTSYGGANPALPVVTAAPSSYGGANPAVPVVQPTTAAAPPYGAAAAPTASPYGGANPALAVRNVAGGGITVVIEIAPGADGPSIQKTNMITAGGAPAGGATPAANLGTTAFISAGEVREAQANTLIPPPVATYAPGRHL